MATPIKIHLDQHVPSALAHALRQYGVDVTTTHETGLQDALDEQHRQYCLANNRVLVTRDTGFIYRSYGPGPCRRNARQLLELMSLTRMTLVSG